MIRETFFLWAASHLPRHRLFDRNRWRLLRLAGVDIAKSDIRAPLVLAAFGQLSRIHIAQGTFVNSGLRVGVDGLAEVWIGENCAIGPNVSFETVGHNLVWSHADGWGSKPKSIKVGDRCWIGAGAIILGGVTIGDGAVIAAGAVVNRDVPGGTVVGGVPARFLKTTA